MKNKPRFEAIVTKEKEAEARLRQIRGMRWLTKQRPDIYYMRYDDKNRVWLHENKEFFGFPVQAE